ncbi:MAG: DUF934 domain-containing protein [Parvularculaceae bacterium]|nr:DUF934 domain-containing protein [Parvularculaceae bacterium]
MAILRLTEDKAELIHDDAVEVISLADWREGARAQGCRRALAVTNDEPVENLAQVLNEFEVVILEAPAFTDGRVFSQARLIRERLAYDGEIRVRGDVLPDQARFLARCGVDTIDIGDAQPHEFINNLSAYTVFYQTGATRSAPAWRLRRRREAA